MPPQRLEEVPVEGQLWEGSGLQPVGRGRTWSLPDQSFCPFSHRTLESLQPQVSTGEGLLRPKVGLGLRTSTAEAEGRVPPPVQFLASTP